MERMEVNPDLERRELARLFGAGKFRRFSRPIHMKVEKLEDRFTELVKPSLYHLSRKIELIGKDSFHVGGSLAFKSSKLSKAMKNCEEMVCFIATIGNGVENEINRLMNENQLSKAYILDAMGSVAVENMVEKFYQRTRTKYKKVGKGVTLRFSPGYCDWHIADQKKIFSLFDSIQLNVELTDFCFMQPRKSISGVFGITPSALNSPVDFYNPCSECEKRDCLARRP